MALTVFNVCTTTRWGHHHIDVPIDINDTSGSRKPYCPLDTPLTRGAKTAAYVILLLLTFVGNVLVVHIIRRNPTLLSSVDLLILNMCVSDLFIPLLAIPYRIKEIYVGNEWIGGDLGFILCKLVLFFGDLTTAVSILSMLAIAIERFRAVVYPTKPTLFTISRCYRAIIVIWVLSAITYCVFFHTISTREAETKTYCTQKWYQDDELHLKAHKIYFTTQIVLLSAIPMVLFCVLYTSIIVSLHHQMTRIAFHLSSEPLRRRAKKNRKIAFMLITFVVTGALAHIPFGNFAFLNLFTPSLVHKLCSKYFIHIFSILFYAPGAVNPVIYFTFNDRYRNGLKQLIGNKASCQTCPGCPASPGQENKHNACAVVVDGVNHEIEMQEIG